MIFIVFLMIFILLFNDFLQNWCKTNCNVFHCFFNGFYWFSLFFNVFRWFLDQFCFFYWFFNDFHYFSTFFIDFLMIFFLFKPTYFSSWEKKTGVFSAEGLQKYKLEDFSYWLNFSLILRADWKPLRPHWGLRADSYSFCNVFHWFPNDLNWFLLFV